MDSWYEDTEFWVQLAPKLFDKSRWHTSPEEIDHLIQLTGMKPGSSVLDLCCGPGRHALELARRGYKVTAVDITSPYLEEGRAIAKSKGIPIEFIKEDMRHFKRPDSYQAIINMFTSFGYFEDQNDNKKVLENAFQSLIKEGILLIDIMGKEIIARIFREREWYQQDDVYYLEERKILDDWTRIENRWIMLKDNKKYEFTFTHWIYSASELSDLLYDSGFKSVKICGNLDGRKYDNQAERLIALAKK